MTNEEIVIHGFVIRNIEYGESDGIINCLTENGVVTFKARGINKLTSKNRASCLLYAESEFTLQSGNGGHLVLTKGKLITSNYKLYTSLDYMTCLGLVSESILTFLDAKTSAEIYQVFEAMLKCLEGNFDIFTMTSIALAKIILESGYGLDVSHCVRCNKQDQIVSISYVDGGFVCKRCLYQNEEVMPTEYLKSVRYCFLVNEDKYFHHQLLKKIAIRLIKEFIQYLQEEFGYKKLGFFELFNQTY